MIAKLLFLFALMILFKFSSNYTAYRKCKKYRKDYLNWVSSSCDGFEEHRSEIIQLMDRAGIPDSRIPVSQVINPIQLASHAASVFANFPTKTPQLATSMYVKFDDAVGVYRNRWKESFNPLYWIETIFFLPKSIIIYIGADLEKSTSRLCNVLATAIWWIFLFLLYLFGGNLYNYVIEFLCQIQ